jgi:hypothetical protein
MLWCVAYLALLAAAFAMVVYYFQNYGPSRGPS